MKIEIRAYEGPSSPSHIGTLGAIPRTAIMTVADSGGTSLAVGTRIPRATAAKWLRLGVRLAVEHRGGEGIIRSAEY